MSILKSEIKMLTAADIGSQLDDQLEEVERERWRNFGAHAGISQSAGQIERQIVAQVKRELDEGKIKDGMTSLEVCSYALRQLSRAKELMLHLADISKNKEIKVSGGAEYLQRAIKIAKKVHDTELEKIRAIQSATEENGIVNETPKAEEKKAEDVIPISRGRRPVGTHPGMSIKQRRLAQGMKEKPDTINKAKGKNASSVKKTKQKKAQKKGN